MEPNIAIAIVSASSAVITAVVALTVNVVWIGRSFDLLAKNLGDKIAKVESRMDKLETSVDMLTGSMHEFDKRLSIIEDRIIRKES